MFKNIHFASSASKKYGINLWEDDLPIFLIQEETFADLDYKKGGWVIQFPYLEDIDISLEKVTSENIDNSISFSNYIERNKPFWIVLDLYANTGTKAKVIVNPPYEEKEMEFNSSSYWRWWPNFKAINKKGEIEISFYINDILWLVHNIEVR